MIWDIPIYIQCWSILGQVAEGLRVCLRSCDELVRHDGQLTNAARHDYHCWCHRTTPNALSRQGLVKHISRPWQPNIYRKLRQYASNLTWLPKISPTHFIMLNHFYVCCWTISSPHVPSFSSFSLNLKFLEAGFLCSTVMKSTTPLLQQPQLALGGILFRIWCLTTNV